MKIGVIGTGYVGLPTGVGLAELGNQVVCIDKDEAKIEALTAGKLTIFEEGLEELFQKNVQSKKLTFTTSMKEGVEGADVVIIAVGTPPHPVTKEADMQYIYAAAEELALCLTDYTVVADKSTVPVGTGDEVDAESNLKIRQQNLMLCLCRNFCVKVLPCMTFLSRIVLSSVQTASAPLMLFASFINLLREKQRCFL